MACMTFKGCKKQRGADWGIRWTLADSAGGIERSLTMQYKHYALRSVLITVLLPAIAAGLTSSEEPALMEQSLQDIEDCMADSPAPWPEAWRQEYVDTIRHAITSHQDTPRYAERLGILSRGFELYWQDLNKSRVVGSKRAPAINPWKSRCAKIVGKKRALDASAQLFWCFLRHGMFHIS